MEHEQGPFARPAGGVEREMWDRATQVAQYSAHSRPGRDATPQPGPSRRRGQSGGRVLKVFTTGASDDLTPRWWLEQRKLVPAAEFHPDLTWMHREGENRNFEPYEVAAALADGWTPHE